MLTLLLAAALAEPTPPALARDDLHCLLHMPPEHPLVRTYLERFERPEDRGWYAKLSNNDGRVTRAELHLVEPGVMAVELWTGARFEPDASSMRAAQSMKDRPSKREELWDVEQSTTTDEGRLFIKGRYVRARPTYLLDHVQMQVWDTDETPLASPHCEALRAAYPEPPPPNPLRDVLAPSATVRLSEAITEHSWSREAGVTYTAEVPFAAGDVALVAVARNTWKARWRPLELWVERDGSYLATPSAYLESSELDFLPNHRVDWVVVSFDEPGVLRLRAPSSAQSAEVPPFLHVFDDPGLAPAVRVPNDVDQRAHAERQEAEATREQAEAERAAADAALDEAMRPRRELEAAVGAAERLPGRFSDISDAWAAYVDAVARGDGLDTANALADHLSSTSERLGQAVADARHDLGTLAKVCPSNEALRAMIDASEAFGDEVHGCQWELRDAAAYWQYDSYEERLDRAATRCRRMPSHYKTFWSRIDERRSDLKSCAP